MKLGSSGLGKPAVRGVLYSIKYKTLWPILLIIALLMSSASYFVYLQVDRSIRQKGETTAEVIRIAMENAITARKTAEDVMEREMIGQAVLASYLVRDFAIQHTQLKELASRSGIDEFWVTDGKGQVVVTNAFEKSDFNFGSDPKGQAYEFMQLIQGSKKSIAQPAQQRTVDPKIYKYVGVAGWSAPAIVQVGRDGERLVKLEEQIGAKSLIQQLQSKLSEDVLFAAILSSDKKVLYSTDQAFEQQSEFQQLTLNAADKASMNASVNGHKTTLYYEKLSNGQSFVIALSGEVLNRILTSTLLATIAGVVIIAAAVYIIVSLLARRLKELQTAMEAISRGDGDLTQRLPVRANDEIGVLASSFNRFSDTIQSIVSEVQATAKLNQTNTTEITALTGRTTAVSKEINLSIDEIAAAATKQAEEVEEGMKSIHEIAHLIQETEAYAKDLSETNRTIHNRQEIGSEAVLELETNMKEYQDRALEVSDNLSVLIADIDGINEMAETIQSISRQTGLLALNASIEAARAGEHGKGFSVVAAEVRKLSEQSTEASDRIQQILQTVLHSTEKTKSVMQLAASSLDKQATSVEHTSSAFHDIASSLQSMSDRIITIRDMAMSMSQLKDTIVSFIESASSITEETAAGSEEVLASVESQLGMIESVNAKAGELQSMMARLTAAVEKFHV